MEIKECNSFFEKFKGLMFKRNFDYALKIRCNGIHTFFMCEPIDVVLTDINNNVVKVYYNLKPNRIILPIKNVYYTYEFPCGYINNMNIGDKLDI